MRKRDVRKEYESDIKKRPRKRVRERKRDLREKQEGKLDFSMR